MKSVSEHQPGRGETPCSEVNDNEILSSIIKSIIIRSVSCTGSVCRVFVLSGPHDHLVLDGLHVAEDDEDPEEEEDRAHGCAYKRDGVVLETLADLDRRDGEAYVGENICVPVQVEVISWDGFNDGAETDGEEPESEHP